MGMGAILPKHRVPFYQSPVDDADSKLNFPFSQLIRFPIARQQHTPPEGTVTHPMAASVNMVIVSLAELNFLLRSKMSSFSFNQSTFFDASFTRFPDPDAAKLLPYFLSTFS
jgi:hypothetical protein